jgi:predicted nucleic acid-binding protein
LRYIDASIPLCAFFGEPKEKLEACRQIIKKIERGEEKARTSVFTVAEIVHVLMKRERPARIEEIIKLHVIDEIYSMDRHFDRFPGIRRLESV